MYRGIVGVENLNNELQKRLNPGQEGLNFGSREIRIFDKVKQIKNNYDKDVFGRAWSKISSGCWLQGKIKMESQNRIEKKSLNC